jgi:hypothetical protein
LSIAINKGELPSSKGLEAEYLEALNMMTDDETSAGYYARTILISQFAFLSGVDEKWVQQRLVPLFTDNSPLRFQHAWHGFLWSRPTRVALALVTPGIFYALTRLKQELSSRAERFIEFYVVVLFRYAETPLTDWTPKFFEVSNDEYRRHFTAHECRSSRTVSG